jgi:DNA polymerase-3 subunit alpha (Gram-positive type)
MPNNRPVEFLSLLKKGDFVKLKGKYDYKKGTQILSFSAYNIYVDTSKKHVDKYDTAIKPRIEVLAHTKFTSADGLNTASDIVKYSINSKMPAIGFCDRGNVQGYPDMDNACTLKKSKNDEVQNEYKQKALYGYEVSVLNKQIDFCINATANSGDLKTQEYVVFDLETTGLFNEDEDIIEFGGIRVKDGNVIDRLDVLIKPTKPVPSFISELTHITNDTLADKKSFSEEIDRILKFIGDSVLIAHNGINFDIRFLNKKLTQLGREPVKNILIDTMQISKALHPSYPRHKLGYICRQNKIMYDDSIAHRADFDAEVLFAVWKIHMNELKELGITKISELNEKLLSKEIYRLTYPMYMNIYAKNKTGLKQLYKLVSLSLTDQFYREKPTLFREQLQEYRENLIICNNPYEGDL